MRTDKLQRLQAEMKLRMSSPHSNSLVSKPAKGEAEARARLAVREALAEARRLKREKRTWAKANKRLRSDKRAWHAALRQTARELNIEGKGLHAEMIHAKAVLKSSRAKLTETTVGEQIAKAYAKGYSLGLEAAGKQGEQKI
jgi:uncharacterized protein involved in exopolysaccharide biosynthesis